MYKMFAVAMTCALALLVFACTSGPSSTRNSANSAGTVTNIDPKNMPPGLSSSPLPVNGSTPGIPDPSQVNVNMKNPGGTPTPGIPDPANVNKVPRGATPTPGIPDEATIKKQMQQLKGSNSAIKNQANTPPAGPVQRAEDMKQRMDLKKKGQ